MKKRLTKDEIRTLLRAADPLLDDDGPSADDAARWRRAMLAGARPQEAPGWRWAPVLAAAVLLVLALHAALTLVDSDRRATDPAGLATTRETPPPAAAAEDVGRRQQVQFVTANGTRVIWVLSSDLSL